MSTLPELPSTQSFTAIHSLSTIPCTLPFLLHQSLSPIRQRPRTQRPPSDPSPCPLPPMPPRCPHRISSGLPLSRPRVTTAPSIASVAIADATRWSCGYSHRSIRRISFATEGGAVLLRQPVTDAFNRRVLSSLADMNALFQCIADDVLKNQNYAQRQQQRCRQQ